MRRLAIALTCTMVAALSHAECSRATRSVPQEYKQADAVIVGTVVSGRSVPQTWDTLDGIDYVVHVDQRVKGKQSGEVTVFSEHSADGYRMEVGKQYLLFLSNNNQHWQVDNCGNSGLVEDEGAVIKELAHMFGND